MRLFFGISLPPSIREAVVRRACACRAVIPGRYVPEDNYHITLAFLGDVPGERVSEAAGVLAQCLERHPAPLLTLGETDYFGRAQNGILIARVHSVPPLEPLHDALICGLRAAALPFDPGPFSPHITLARHACVPASPLPGGESLSFAAGHAHLYLSARNEWNILAYTPLKTFSFSSSASSMPPHFSK